MKVKELIKPNTLDIKASEMRYPNIYDIKNLNYGKRKKLRYEKVTVRDSKTGKIYGRRTIVQKST